jgi:BlaI family penicillinase repressor
MKQPPLANSELAVMDLLWNKGQLTARQIRELLYAGSSKAQHGTVQKLLQRLEEKGYIERDSRQFVHQFTAKVTRQAYAGEQLEFLAAKLTAGSIAPLITHLFKKSKISSDDIEEIKAVINKYKETGEKDD